MLWEEYQSTYTNYLMATSQVQIVTLLAAESVKDFPQNLPADLKKPLVAGFVQIGESIMKLLQPRKNKKTSKEYKVSVADDPTQGKLLESVLTLFASQIVLKKVDNNDENLQLGFERLLILQQLVMLYAYLDAFMGDTLRAICRIRPEVLKSGKKIEWSIALAFESKEELLAHLIERYVFEFGWLPLIKRLDLLKKEIGLKIELPDAELQLLAWAENVRHVAVHNGGRVSSEFIERTGKTDLALGQFVPMSFKELEQTSNAALLLAGDLFIAVSKKFFDIDGEQLTAMVRRSGSKSPRARSQPASSRAKSRHRSTKKDIRR